MRLVLVNVAVALAAVPCGAGADSRTPAADLPTPAANTSSQPTALPHVSVLTGDQVIQILDDTVDWYRTLGTQQQNATQPSDLLILYANRQTADKVVALAFDIARANAELLSSEAGKVPSAGDASSSPEALDGQRAALEKQRTAILAEMDANRRSGGAAQTGTAETRAKVVELQGELDMVNARSNLLDTMVQFVNENDAKRASVNALKAHIDAIAVSIPAASGTATVAATAPASGIGTTDSGATAGLTARANGGSTPAGMGIWDLGSQVLRLAEKIRTTEAIEQRTAALEQTFHKIRSAPLERLQTLTARSDALAAEADNATGARLKSVRDEFDSLAWYFKQTSGILIPLSKGTILLAQYRSNLSNWRSAVKRQYHDVLGALAVRLGALIAVLATLFIAAEIWRRTVLKYVTDPRRRYQMMLARRIALWVLVVLILGFTFVTELSSFATFAGLITAGIAVAMQSVLVSIVGYFFLIGKYGVRVGDRVQIGSVTGEVIDLGLVRMHLMELSPQGPLGPTGRIVAFANSIVFQSSSGLFRQIPGVNFTWHEVSFPLPAGCDYAAAKDKLIAALTTVVETYRDEIERQTLAIETTASISADTSAQVQLQFATSGVEAHIRYPVPLRQAAEIDERVSEEILKVIAGLSATPKP